MSDKKCNDLISLFPELYRDPYPESSGKYSMQLFGFECEDGWYDLLYSLSQKISEYLKQNPLEDFYVQQVKNKYGILSFYYSGYSEEIETRINEATKEAINTCERCGSKEDIKPHGKWIMYLCSNCRETELK